MNRSQHPWCQVRPSEALLACLAHHAGYLPSRCRGAGWYQLLHPCVWADRQVVPLACLLHCCHKAPTFGRNTRRAAPSSTAGSGKTHTITGRTNSAQHKGLVPRMFEDLFAALLSSKARFDLRLVRWVPCPLERAGADTALATFAELR